MRILNRRFILVALLLVPAVSSPAALRLPHVFTDHLVLQRDQRVPVWGWSDPDDEVTVEFAGQRKSVRTDMAGRWMLRLDPMPASADSRDLVVSSAKSGERLERTDVVVGEVWLCSGQSNMEWTMGNSHEAKSDIPSANFPLIRHFGVPKSTAAVAQPDVNCQWTVCSPATVGGFTAVGYFFGLELHKQLQVPVGLLHSSWGGTRIEPWTTPEGFAVSPALAELHKRVEAMNPGSEANRRRMREYLALNETWLGKAKAALDAGLSVESPPAFPAEASLTRQNSDPCALYNAMIHPLVPFGMRGAIWYQGESNHGEGRLYTEKTRALVEGWRKVWGQGDFPYYYVQIAPFQYGEEDPLVLPAFWEAQAAILEAVTNSGMAVIHDVGDVRDIHPRNKKEVGRRLALQALARTYGRNDVAWSGPVFKALTIETGKIRVNFDHAAGGLKTRDGQPPSHFEIVGADTDYVPANAVIEGDSVVLSSPQCPSPVAVRFGWHKTAEPNLQNGAGFPAVQFRAGSVPRPDALGKIAEARDYRLVYDLDLAKLGREIVYDEDRTASVGPFDRVAYFLELKKGGAPAQYLYVSMDAFTTNARALGVPTAASGIRYQSSVSNLTVLSNVDGIATGERIAGNIEFWPNNYGTANSAQVPGADEALYDFGDQPVEPVDGYGCMQVHHTAARQTLWAVNQWVAGAGANIGIGNSTGQSRDWTFVPNAGQYTSKRLRVFIRSSR